MPEGRVFIHIFCLCLGGLFMESRLRIRGKAVVLLWNRVYI